MNELRELPIQTCIYCHHESRDGEDFHAYFDGKEKFVIAMCLVCSHAHPSCKPEKEGGWMIMRRNTSLTYSTVS